mgnify:CR=1 FL=1
MWKVSKYFWWEKNLLVKYISGNCILCNLKDITLHTGSLTNSLMVHLICHHYGKLFQVIFWSLLLWYKSYSWHKIVIYKIRMLSYMLYKHSAVIMYRWIFIHVISASYSTCLFRIVSKAKSLKNIHVICVRHIVSMSVQRRSEFGKQHDAQQFTQFLVESNPSLSSICKGKLTTTGNI